MSALKILLPAGALAMFLVAGCKPAKPTSKSKPDEKHAEIGPHTGAIAEWDAHGVHMHAEFTVNHKDSKATVYVLDEDAKKNKPIQAEEITVMLKDPAVTFKLVAFPQKSDPTGMSSRFVGTHPALATEKDFEGTISATVAGKEFTGDFRETD